MAERKGAGILVPEAGAEGVPLVGRRRRDLSPLRRVALAVALVALLAAWGLTALSLHGPARNSLHAQDEHGLQELHRALLADDYAVATLGAGPHALDAFEAPSRTVLLVVGVDRSYTPGEVDAIVAFVERGGMALIADDGGLGDPVGQRFGVNVDVKPLYDASFSVNRSIVVVNATLGGLNLTFHTNGPTSLGLEPGLQAVVLAESTSDSFIDANDNGVEDYPGDVKGPATVAVQVNATRGPGRAVFLSDPGVFQDGLAARNREFLRTLFRTLLPEGGTVAVDESRHRLDAGSAALAGLLAGEVQASSEPVLAGLLGLAGTLVAALAFATYRRPQDLTLHRSRLGDPVHRLDDASTRRRLQALAARAVADVHNMPAEAFQAATPQQLARMASDPLVAAVVRGDLAKAAPEDVLRRLQALKEQRPAARAPEAGP